MYFLRIEYCIKSKVSSVTYQPRHQTCDWLGQFVKVSQDKSVEVARDEARKCREMCFLCFIQI